MQLSEFLDFDAIKPSLSAGNKRVVLQQLAQIAAARLDVDPGEVLSSVSERERLGSTGFGHGVAIPHGKIVGLNRIYCLFARLSDPVDYKSIDGQRVALVEYRAEDPSVPILPTHKMTQEQAKKEMAAVGLRWLETKNSLPQQHLMLFEKPAR